MRKTIYVSCSRAVCCGLLIFGGVLLAFGSRASAGEVVNGYVYVAPSYQPLPPIVYDPFLTPIAPPAPMFVPAPPAPAPVIVPGPIVVPEVVISYGPPAIYWERRHHRRWRHRTPYGRVEIDVDDDGIEYEFKWRD